MRRKVIKKKWRVVGVEGNVFFFTLANDFSYVISATPCNYLDVMICGNNNFSAAGGGIRYFDHVRGDVGGAVFLYLLDGSMDHTVGSTVSNEKLLFFIPFSFRLRI